MSDVISMWNNSSCHADNNFKNVLLKNRLQTWNRSLYQSNRWIKQRFTLRLYGKKQGQLDQVVVRAMLCSNTNLCHMPTFPGHASTSCELWHALSVCTCDCRIHIWMVSRLCGSWCVGPVWTCSQTPCCSLASCRYDADLGEQTCGENKVRWTQRICYRWSNAWSSAASETK